MTISSLQLGLHWFPERPGGLDRVFNELYRTLPAAGVAFRGLVAGGPRAAADTGGAVTAFAPADARLYQRWLGMRRAFAAAQATERPDLVVSHFALYTLPVLDLIKDQPLAIHFQGPWADEGRIEGHVGLQSHVKRVIERLVYRRATRAIVLSTAFAQILVERYRVPAERVSLIPGGIDMDRFAIAATRAQARDGLGLPGDRPILVAVRRLVPRMGLGNLITALATLRRTHPDVLLLIAGEGMLRASLAAQIAELELTDNVKLLGRVSDEDLPYLYRAADLTVVPTVALEGWGMIAAESLAAGTPCIVTPVGGLPEVVQGLCADLIVPDLEVTSLTATLQAALRGELRLPDETSCIAYARANYAWPLIAARVAAVYRQALL
jgi:glycosyltransferase involved in cell wall biosynthesis